MEQLDSGDSYSDDSIVLLDQDNKAKKRKLPASNESPPARSKQGSAASSVAKQLLYDTDDDSQDKHRYKHTNHHLVHRHLCSNWLRLYGRRLLEHRRQQLEKGMQVR